MDLLIAWVVFPLVLGVLALGCGLLVQWATGLRLATPLVMPTGVAAIVMIAQLVTLAPSTARFATPAVVVAALAGLALSWPSRWRPSFDGWVVAAVLGVFAVFAAPVVLSGEATFAGYIKLDDTATWLAMVDRVMTHGRDIGGLPHSSYRETLSYTVANGYPVGSLLPLGVARALVGQDAAWVFQPYLTFLAAMLASTLWAIFGRLVASRRMRALAVFLGAQPALLFGYAMWGGIKELVAAPLVALIAALVPSSVRAGSIRALIPLAVASTATLAVLGYGGAVWLAPLLIPAAIAVVRLRRGRLELRQVLVFAAVAVALSVPLIVGVGPLLRSTQGLIEATGDLGNLIKPLSDFQLAGIWVTGDFRTAPTEHLVTYVLIGVVAVAAMVGLLAAWRRRVHELPLYVWGAVAGALVVAGFGSPWVGAKALAIASPALLSAAVAGGAIVFERAAPAPRVVAGAALAAIAAGVLWSNVLAYHEVWVAPRNQLAELQDIGKRVAGQGPTLVTEYEPYGARHFLRNADPEGANSVRWRAVRLINGQLLAKGDFADLDQFQLPGLLVYRTLVLRRSPAGSRPPAPYQLVLQGRYYEVWQRDDPPVPTVLEHLPLGDPLQPAATPSCGTVLSVAAVARRNRGRVAAVVRPPTSVANLAQLQHPASWLFDGKNPGVLHPRGPGEMTLRMLVPSGGRYQVWLGGSFRGEVRISVDGKPAGSARDQLNNTGQYEPFGAVDLAAGAHQVRIKYSLSDLDPGSGGQQFGFGPLVLSQGTADQRIVFAAPDQAASLCHLNLDWLEAVVG